MYHEDCRQCGNVVEYCCRAWVIAVRAGHDIVSHRQVSQDYLRGRVISGRFRGQPTELNGHCLIHCLLGRLAIVQWSSRCITRTAGGVEMLPSLYDSHLLCVLLDGCACRP